MFIYTGDKNQTQEDLINIKVTSVTNALMHKSDFSIITCYESETFEVSGTLDVPDRLFTLPIKRDDGRLILFPVKIINKEFKALLNFPTSGKYDYTEEEANMDFPTKIFTVQPFRIDVLRKVIT